MAKKSDISRIARLDELSVLLKNEFSYTTGELSKLLHVSHRTISRDINLLRDQGFPIEADRGRGGGLRLHRNWTLDHIYLNINESIDLLISLAVAEKMNSPIFFDKMHILRNKILASFSPRKQKQLKHLSNRILVGYPASFQVIEGFNKELNKNRGEIYKAFFELKLLKILYCDEKGMYTERIMEPHYLFLNYPVWYILAFDHLRNASRTFRFDRIEKASCINSRSFQLLGNEDFIKDLQDCSDPIT